MEPDLSNFYSFLKKDAAGENKIGNTYQNLGDQVYETLKNKIISHEIKPGERVMDKSFAKELGVSRSLVRQAFNALEKEELLISVPRSGFYVREIQEEDVEEIYDIRILLEKYITKIAVPRIPDEEIERLLILFNEVRDELEQKNLNRIIKADISLHEMLINNCGNDRLRRIIYTFNNHIFFYRIVDLSQLERAREAYFEHAQLLEVIKSRDVERAVELMGKHIEYSKNVVLNNFYKYTYE